MRQETWQGEEVDNAIRAFVERRRRRRVQAVVSIRVKGIDIRGIPFEESTESVNFSAGGTCFILKQRIRVGMTVLLGITLPSDLKTYRTTGLITRVEAEEVEPKYKYGIRFVHKKDRQRTSAKRNG